VRMRETHRGGRRYEAPAVYAKKDRGGGNRCRAHAGEKIRGPPT
jgi:hypothetical protein